MWFPRVPLIFLPEWHVYRCFVSWVVNSWGLWPDSHVLHLLLVSCRRVISRGTVFHDLIRLAPFAQLQFQVGSALLLLQLSSSGDYSSTEIGSERNIWQLPRVKEAICVTAVAKLEINK